MTQKRILDVVGAASALILLSPILGAVAIAIRLFLGRPIVFRQIRPGYLERPFTIYKLRTMREAVDPNGIPLPDAKRLTPFGAFLRRASLDELPEFWNVLRGDMSLVGPRPLLMKYLPLYTEEERVRFTMRPGITGWAQVNGRNALTWGQKFELDAWYVEHWSFWLDVKILWLTVLQVLKRNGINQSGHATMPEFTGTPK